MTQAMAACLLVFQMRAVQARGRKSPRSIQLHMHLYPCRVDETSSWGPGSSLPLPGCLLTPASLYVAPDSTLACIGPGGHGAACTPCSAHANTF